VSHTISITLHGCREEPSSSEVDCAARPSMDYSLCSKKCW
jgi:hypothetical protein